MRNEFAKCEIKTSVFSGRKSQAGNCCLQPQGAQLGELLFIARPDLDKSIGDEEDRTRRGLWLSSASPVKFRGDVGYRIIAPRCSPGSLSDDSRIATSNSIDHELVPFLRSGFARSERLSRMRAIAIPLAVDAGRRTKGSLWLIP